MDIALDIPGRYLTRSQLSSQLVAVKGALSRMIAVLPTHVSEPAWVGDDLLGISRFRGHDIALLVCYNQTLREMLGRGYRLPNYTPYLVQSMYLYPEVMQPDKSRTARDLVEVATSWARWEADEIACWNRGHAPLFSNADGPVSSSILDAQTVHEAEQHVVPSFQEGYLEDLNRFIDETEVDLQFAHLNQEKLIKLTVEVQGVPANTELSAWLDPRTGRSTPALAEHPETGRSLVVYPTEYRDVSGQ